MLKTKPDLISSAREDLEQAVEQFPNFSDKARQFQLRSMLESVTGNFQESLMWLSESVAIEKDLTPIEILSRIKKFEWDNIFDLFHYANLMARAMTARHPLGKEMFDAWTNLNAEDLLKNSSQYPVPIILWRAGKCRALQRQKTAKKFYDAATKILLANPANLTFFAEGLIIEADQFATIDEGNNRKFLSRIQEHYKIFSLLQPPASMRSAFSEWEKLDAVAKKLSPEQLRDFFANLVRKIPVI